MSVVVNKTIARFMGVTVVREGEKNNPLHYTERELKYDSSWDWFMEAYQKLRNIYQGAGIGDIAPEEVSELERIKQHVLGVDLSNSAHFLAAIIRWREENKHRIDARKKY